MASDALPQIVLAGNPNAGKTTIFNALTGLRMHTSNYAGTTVARKSGIVTLGERKVELIDLPGMYSLNAATPEEKVSAEILLGHNPAFPHPTAVVVVLDAANLERNLFLFSQITECNLPVIVALTMLDHASDNGMDIDTVKLAEKLGCAVIPLRVLQGEGLEDLVTAIGDVFVWGPDEYPRPHKPSEAIRCGHGCGGCPFNGRFTWSESIVSEVVKSRHAAPGRLTESLDEVLTHPWLGMGVFLLIMSALFYSIFALASLPMDLIEGVFGALSEWLGTKLPDNDFSSFLRDGVLAGVGGVLVFLPQICILFFLLALLEDSGYLSRAAFVMDRVMRRVGLPGTAFVPMVSGHACAIPAILSTRVISDWRDRLVTIFVIPFMSCSARLPVYSLLLGLLFPTEPLKAALLFTSAYALGVLAALSTAWLLKKTVLPGESQPLLLELPPYKRPRFRNALLHTWTKASQFLKQAGTVILVISMLLWVLVSYPKVDPPAEIAADKNAVAEFQIERSIAGTLGRAIEPVIRPLGFDWQIGIGILSSFAAREVIASTLSIVYGLGPEAEELSLRETLRQASGPDGLPVFDFATCMSLLVFYVLAMQCLPTQAVTRAETGSWKWAAAQLVYMTVVAYTASFIVYQVLR
jgi:ferrous iron transport protein B